MSVCAHCGQQILFGGVKQGTLRYCNQKCFDAAFTNQAYETVPEELVEESLEKIHQGECPYCGGPGPVDFHYSYRVMSFLILTQYRTIPKISCASCAKKSNLWNFLVTFVMGWWGVPFGLVLTPIYLARNTFAAMFPASSTQPSSQLREFVCINLMSRQMAQPQVIDADTAEEEKETFTF
ncbi:MAG: hypothetical protein LBQ54_03220 [Planctomycetaceae bacterium]|jgi:hypothetical protein|nr:hypothetical protein [Planctomycetaceae bacterium]